MRGGAPVPIFHVAFSSREMLVKRKLLFLPIACITRNGVPSPASQAILRRSARSIPMFRADFLPFTSKIVEHSRYLPARHAKQTKISVKQLVVFSAMLWL